MARHQHNDMHGGHHDYHQGIGQMLLARARCPIPFKRQVCSAVVRTKGTDGREGAHVSEASRSQTNVLRLEGLRKALGMKAKRVDRRNSNKEVDEKANRRADMGEGAMIGKMEDYLGELGRCYDTCSDPGRKNRRAGQR